MKQFQPLESNKNEYIQPHTGWIDRAKNNHIPTVKKLYVCMYTYIYIYTSKLPGHLAAHDLPPYLQQNAQNEQFQVL